MGGMKRALVVTAILAGVASCSPPTTQSWNKQTSNTTADLYAVQVFKKDSVLAVGANSTTVANVDGAWRERKLGSPDTLTALWGRDDSDVMIVGGVEGAPGVGVAFRTGPGFYQYQAQAMPTGTDMLRAVHGTSMQDVWAVGDRNTAVHFDGSRWSPVSIPGPANSPELNFNGVWCRSDHACWAAGSQGMVARWNGTTWTVVQGDTQGRTLRAVHGTDAFVLIVGDGSAILRETADGTLSPEGGPVAGRHLHAVWSAGGNDSWATGPAPEGANATVLRVQGTTDWTAYDKLKSEYGLRGITGLTSNEMWAVGDRGTIYRFGQ